MKEKTQLKTKLEDLKDRKFSKEKLKSIAGGADTTHNYTVHWVSTGHGSDSRAIPDVLV